MLLTRDATNEALAAHLVEHHAALAPLLPQDTTVRREQYVATLAVDMAAAVRAAAKEEAKKSEL